MEPSGCQPLGLRRKAGAANRQVMPTPAFGIQILFHIFFSLTVPKCTVGSVLPLKNFPRDGLRDGDRTIYHPSLDLKVKGRAVNNYASTTVINQD